MTALVVGLGTQGSAIAKALVAKGAEIVAAVDPDPALAGRPLAEVLGDAAAGTAVVQPSVAAAIDSARVPQIAVLAATGDMEAFHALARACVERGMHVITIQGVAFHPWRDDEALTRDLDACAREHGVAVLATGVQDISWVAPAAVFSAGMLDVERIAFLGTVNLETYPSRIVKDRLVDPPDEAVFERAFASGRLSWVFKPALEALAEQLDLRIREVELRSEPVRCEQPRWCEALGRELSAGTIVGCRELTRVLTDGPELTGDFGMYVFAPGEASRNAFTIDGEARLEVDQPSFPGFHLTNASVINRIPDLLAAGPGYHPAHRLGPPRLHRSLTPATAAG